MRIRNYQKLARDFQLDQAKASTALREELKNKSLTPSDFSIRALAETTVKDGREWVASMDPRYGDGVYQEAVGAISTTLFTNITRLLVSQAVMDGYEAEDTTFTKLIPTVQTRSKVGEIVPGITGLGDAAGIVPEGELFPLAGVTEDWIQSPPPVKRGFIVPLTKEAVFFDITGILVDRASKVGESMALNKEKRAIDCVIDENTTAHRYKWRNNTIATYGDSSGTHTWDNLAASNGLVDFTQVDAAEQLLASMTDPFTGEPISIRGDTIIATPQMIHRLRSILNATQVTLSVGGFPTTGNPQQTQSINPLGGGPFSADYGFVTSRQLAARMATDTTWYIGNPRRAFRYYEAWGITVTQAPTNSEAEFLNDIVLRFKASECGAYGTVEPRIMVKNTA